MIDVDFHDNTIHHAFRIKNVLNHTVAALSKDALVLGCEAQDDLPRYIFVYFVNDIRNSIQKLTLHNVLFDKQQTCMYIA